MNNMIEKKIKWFDEIFIFLLSLKGFTFIITLILFTIIINQAKKAEKESTKNKHKKQYKNKTHQI